MSLYPMIELSDALARVEQHCRPLGVVTIRVSIKKFNCRLSRPLNSIRDPIDRWTAPYEI
jgi:hypothetical protein